MLLPRPARLIKQRLLYPVSSSHAIRSIPFRRSASTSQIVKDYEPPEPPLDPSYGPLLDDVRVQTDLSAKQFRRFRADVTVSPRKEETMSVGVVPRGSGSAKRFGMRKDEQEVGDEEEFSSQREEQRSPAVVMGSKRIGSVQIPRELEEAILDIMEGMSVPSL
jgi:hypothetical protein